MPVSIREALTPEFRTFLEELFYGLGPVELRPMFGVHALYHDGTMFAVVADTRVFLKTDEKSRPEFAQEAAAPFRFRARDGTEVVTSYYELPARLYDQPDEAVAWARRACEIAMRSPSAARKARKRVKKQGAIPGTAGVPPARRRNKRNIG